MIKSISIKNFKSFESISFEIPNFALIIGYNGAGKTNLLTAIRFISLLTSGKQIDAVLETLNILPTEFFHNNENLPAEFNLDLNIKSKSIKYSFEITKLPNSVGLSVGKEVLLVQNEEILRRESNLSITIKKNNDNVPNQPIVNNQLAISVIEGVQIVTEIKDWLSKIIVDTFEPILLKTYGSPAKSQGSLSNNLAERLYYLKNNKMDVYNEVINVFKKMIYGLESVDVEVNPNGTLILKFKEQDVSKEYRSYSASNGNLRTMGIVLALYGEPKPSAVFIDEIENALHPSRIHSVIQTLKYLTQQEQNHLQVIMTSHNPILLDYVDSKEIVYCYKKVGKTFFVNPYKNSTVMFELQQAKDQNLSLSNLFATGSLENIFTTDLQ